MTQPLDPIAVSVIQHRLLAIVEEMGEAMLRTARVPLVALHSNLLVRTANEAFYKTFGLSPHEVENFSIFSMKGGGLEHPGTPHTANRSPAAGGFSGELPGRP